MSGVVVAVEEVGDTELIAQFKIELVILKNRNGATGGKLEYEYYPLFNYFREVPTPPEGGTN